MPKRRYTFWINEAEAAGLRLVTKADDNRDDWCESDHVRQAIRDYLKRKGIDLKAAPRRAGTRRRGAR
jgi:hypothetical protein